MTRKQIRQRSIPAWAGKPLCHARQIINQTVYPRVGGETFPPRPRDSAAPGLSPRGRGNLRNPQSSATLVRSIPAWAGKPAPRRTVYRLCWVYPRVGGETPIAALPRADSGGLSPRGRGNRLGPTDRLQRDGSIPAWAGKPHPPSPRTACSTVYPRVGGETRTGIRGQSTSSGLSPRGRGNLVQWIIRLG